MRAASNVRVRECPTRANGQQGTAATACKNHPLARRRAHRPVASNQRWLNAGLHPPVPSACARHPHHRSQPAAGQRGYAQNTDDLSKMPIMRRSKISACRPWPMKHYLTARPTRSLPNLQPSYTRAPTPAPRPAAPRPRAGWALPRRRSRCRGPQLGGRG